MTKEQGRLLLWQELEMAMALYDGTFSFINQIVVIHFQANIEPLPYIKKLLIII